MVEDQRGELIVIHDQILPTSTIRNLWKTTKGQFACWHMVVKGEVCGLSTPSPHYVNMQILLTAFHKKCTKTIKVNMYVETEL